MMPRVVPELLLQEIALTKTIVWPGSIPLQPSNE